MSGSAIQDLVAEKIKILYSISQELESLFPGRHYTPDGHMIGSIGEALAACCYGLLRLSGNCGPEPRWAAM